MRLSWLISLGITLIGFLIMGNLFTIEPEEPGANGNYGFVGIILILPFILLSIFTTYRYFLSAAGTLSGRVMRGILIVGGLCAIAILLYLTFNYKNQVLSVGKPYAGNLSNVLELNEYTYSIYFNFYTFALIHAISAFLGSVVGVFKNREAVE